MKKIAIITARAGSKGLPDKNMLMVDGKPLLAYSIETALEAKIFDKIVLTTDSQEYIDALSHYPIEFIKRAPHLATDKASTYQALEDVILQYSWFKYDYFVQFQPTTPLRSVQDCINICIAFEENINRFDFAASVTSASKPTVLTHTIDEDKSMKNWDIDYSNYARQNYPPEYSANGVFYIAKPQAYLEQKHFYGARSMAYFMDKSVSVDIDDLYDFEHFYYLIRKRKRSSTLYQNTLRDAALKRIIFSSPKEVSFLGGSLLALYHRELCLDRTVQNLALVSATAEWYEEIVLSSKNLSLSPHIILSFGRDELRYENPDIHMIVQQTLRCVNIIAQLAPEATLYMLECPRGLFRVDLQNSLVDLYNNILVKELKSFPNIQWISTNEHFTDNYGKLSSRYTRDGLNLNEEGYKKLEKIIDNAISK